jgi:hypothetical protein
MLRRPTSDLVVDLSLNRIRIIKGSKILTKIVVLNLSGNYLSDIRGLCYCEIMEVI